MTPALLAAAGRLLYGAGWQSAMSRDLDVADRTVRRWAAGDSTIPPGIAGELAARLRTASAECRAMAQQLGRLAA